MIDDFYTFVGLTVLDDTCLHPWNISDHVKLMIPFSSVLSRIFSGVQRAHQPLNLGAIQNIGWAICHS